MKKLYILLAVVMGLSLKAQTPCGFTITPNPGPYSITCTNSFVLLSVAPAAFSYTWSSLANPPINGTSATFTSIGTYTLTGSDPGCTTSSQTFAVVFNTVAPTTSVSPNSQVINCTNSVGVTFSGTCTNPTVNMQHDWFSPLSPLPAGPPIATTNNTISILSGAVPPGIYTLQTTNLVTGCKAFKTVTVTSLSSFPTFSVGSTTGFSVGCVPLNSTTISIINPVSTQTPPATCSYTFLAPGFGGTLAPGNLGGNTSTITTLPGTWTVIVHDNSNSCRSVLTVPIIQNTVGPHVLATMALSTQTLTCTNPTLLATGSSTTGNTVVTWNIPQNPPNLSTPTCIVGPVTGPNTSTTSLTYASYTVIAQNTLNACQTTSIVQIYQNFKPPISSPTISIATPTAIYCNALTNPAILTTGQSTTTSGGGPTAFVSNPCWAGPSPQTPTCGTSYTAFTVGIYTLTVQDNYNGCYGSGTVNVLDRTQPPVITNSVGTSIMDCNTEQATLNFALTGTMTGGVRYLITTYPAGAAFNPTSAINVNVNPDLSGTSSNSVLVSKTGLYVWVVTNTLTGCKATGSITVSGSDLQALMEASPETGYSPLDVAFFNNSKTSINSLSITSVWSFGNGSSKTTTSTAQVSTRYEAPGTYTVMLIAIKGSCIDTTYKTIKVEIPSKLEVPNIFTPNGDGSNDLFFMKVAGLSEITAIIFDRWGNKVYDVTSKTGNISWDGKNLSGKECPSGVYYYVIKATGKDAVEYEQKGNVSLYR